MTDENEQMIPKKQSLFPFSPDDIVDNALQNLDENQVREITKKAADEVVKIAVEKRKAEYRNSAAQEEMRNLIENANLLDNKVGDYKINSTFETASGTTNVEIRSAKSNSTNIIAIAVVLAIIISLITFLLIKN